MATLPQTHVFELSQQSSDSVKQNGEYTVHFAEPITMQPGDQLSMRMASIDSQRSDSNSIILPLNNDSVNTPVSIQFSYYDCNYDICGGTDPSGGLKYKFGTATPYSADFEIYSAYNQQGLDRLDKVSFHCPYAEPGAFGVEVIVFPHFSWVDRNGKHQHNPGGFKTLFDYYQYRGSTDGPPSVPAVCVAQPEADGVPGYIEFRSGTLTLLGWTVLENLNVAPSYTAQFLSQEVSNISAPSSRELATGTAGFVLPPGRYDRETLAVKLTEGFNAAGLDKTKYLVSGVDRNLFIPDSQLVINMENPDYRDMVFRKMDVCALPTDQSVNFTTSNTYSYVPKGGEPTAVQIGARKFAFEYGNTGDAFQLSAAHQSVNNPGDVGKETVAFFATGGSNQNLFEVPRATGILIHEMQPKELWDDVMGIYDAIVAPLQTDVCGKPYPLLQNMVQTPQESAELSVFTPKNHRINPTPPTVAKPVFVDTTSIPTKAVVGDSPRVNQSGGYFLVEITGLNTAQSNFVDSETNRPNISAIVSTQYDNNDIVTGFADSAIQYVHRGAPTTIASAKVRILDPLTKEVVPTLGAANSIFLDLVSQAPVYQPPQPAPSTDKDQKSES
jgi:hypothetical protein